MKKIDVKAFSEGWKVVLKEKVSNIPLHLVIIQVGDNPASNAYIRGKLKDSEELGVQASLRKYPEDVTEKELLDDIEILNMIPYYSGIIVQLPLPKNLNEEKILNKINPFKDVDGLAPFSPILPCTPCGVIYLLEHITVLEGKTINVIGRSKLIGAPLARELEKRNATVIHCNSRTPNNSRILAWEFPWTEEPGGLQSWGCNSRYNLVIKSPPYIYPLFFKESFLI